MITKVTKEEALEYHRVPNPGKVAIATTTRLETQRDLSNNVYTRAVVSFWW